jgi:hypothetical protein
VPPSGPAGAAPGGLAWRTRTIGVSSSPVSAPATPVLPMKKFA